MIKFMFGINTGETISNELLNTYEAWDKYVAHIWYNLLYFMDFNSNSTLIEVAPGGSLKIAYALKKLDFSGVLYLIEPATIGEKITKQYQKILPCAKIILVSKKISESINSFQNKIDFVIGNHVLDDMIMLESKTHIQNTQLFSWVEKKELAVDEVFKEKWLSIHANKNLLNNIKNEVYDEIVSFIDKIFPRVTILSQYPSLVLENEGLSLLNRHSYHILKNIKSYYKTKLIPGNQIQKILNANKNYNFSLLGRDMLNAKNWMVIKREC